MKAVLDRRSVLVLALSAVVLSAWLGTRGLNEPDEGRYAELSREMALQDSWLIPHLNGVPHFQKPPMLYWITACSIRLFGVNDWAARLPTALAAFGTIACTMLMAGVLFGPGVRWKSGLILLSSIEFVTLARVLTHDMLLAFWITAAIAGFVVYARCGHRVGLAAFYLLMGLGFLTKGPLAIFIPMAAAVVWQVANKRFGGTRRGLYLWLGLPVTLVIGLSWFLLVCQRHPELYNYFLRHELVDRIATNVHKRHEPFWYFGPILAAGFLPWTFFLPSVAAQFYRRGAFGRPTAWLFVGWVAIPFLVLSLVNSKLVTYVLPLFPPLSLMVARGWDEVCGRRPWRISVGLAASFFLIVLGVLPLVVYWYNTQKGYQIPFGLSAVLAALAMVVLFGASLRVAITNRSPAPVLPCLAAGVVILFLTVMSRADTILRSGNAAMRDAARLILAVRSGPDVPIFVCDVRANGIEFYTQQLVMRTLSGSDVVLPMDAALDARIIEDSAAFMGTLVGKEAFVLVKAGRYKRDPVFTGWPILMKAGTCVLITPPGTNAAPTAPAVLK